MKASRLSSLLARLSLSSALPIHVNTPNTPNTPGLKTKQKKRSKTPAALQKWRFVTAICLMFSLAIALEVALAISVKRGGFPTGNMTTSKVQFYSSFIPTLSITALAWYWRSLDRAYRRMQPYVNMLHGPAAAQDSVLLDMEHMNFLKLLRLSLQTRRYLVLISTSLAFLGIFYHSFASSLFYVKTVPTIFPADTHVQSLNTLGLNPRSQDLSSFVAAAGFAEAAAYYGLRDPPFVKGPWAVSSFLYPPDISANSTVTVNTTAIETQLNCTSIPVDVLPDVPLPSNTTLQVTIAPGCSRTVVLDPTSSSSQYGAQPITNCSINGQGDILSPEFAPVLFWFYTIGSGTGQILARAVFCETSLRTAAVQVTVDGETGLLTKLNVITDLTLGSNNITSGAFVGDAFNGIAFDEQNPAVSFNLSNPFIAARALATQTQVPGAIFRLATDATVNPGGFTTQGILSITQHVYTQYLSVVALGNYFVPASEEIVGDVTLWPSRLFMNPITVHILSGLLIIISFIEIALYYLYRKRSRTLFLGTRPGFIAHCMSLLPQMDGSIMAPTDTKESLKRKLDNMQFMLDDQGYIVGLQPQELDFRRLSMLSQEKSLLKFHPEPYQDQDAVNSPPLKSGDSRNGDFPSESESCARPPSAYSWKFSRDGSTHSRFSTNLNRRRSTPQSPNPNRAGELDDFSSPSSEENQNQKSSHFPPPGLSHNTNPSPPASANSNSNPPINLFLSREGDHSSSSDSHE